MTTAKYNAAVAKHFKPFATVLTVPADTPFGQICETVRCNGASEFVEGMTHAIVEMVK